MRIAVISDIHGNSVAFDKVINDINIQNIEEILFLGDLVSKGPNPKSVLDKLKILKPIAWIKGNSDTWFDEGLDRWEPKNEIEIYLHNNYKFLLESLSNDDLKFIREIPIKRKLEINGYNILCVHGSPRRVDEDLSPELTNEQLRLILDGVKEDIILSGHIDEPYIRKINDKIIINPGTVGLCNKHGDSRASYAIIELENNIKVEFRKIKYNNQQVIALAKEKGLPNIDIFLNFLKRGY